MPILNKLSILGSKGFFLSFAIFGYGLVALLVQNPESSRAITIPFRLVILVSSILFVVLPHVLPHPRSNANHSPQQVKFSKSTTKSRFHRLWIGILLTFTIIYSLRVISASLFGGQELKNPASEYFIFWFFVTLLPAINFISLSERTALTFRRVSLCILAFSVFLLLPTALSNPQNFIGLGRFSTAAINPISLGHLGVSLSLLSSYVWLKDAQRYTSKYSRNKSTILTSTVLLSLSSLGTLLCLFSASSGPILALSVCLFFLIFFNKKDAKVLFFLLFASIFSFAALAFVTSNGSAILERLSNPLVDYSSQYNSNFYTRGQILSTGFSLFLEHPLLGAGIEVPSIGYLHNLVLESFYSTGIFSGILFVSCYLYAASKSIYMLSLQSSAFNWIGILYIQYAVGALFSGSLYGSYPFWYLLFSVIGVKGFKSV